MIKQRPYQEPRAENQEPRIKNRFYINRINKPVQKTNNLFVRSAVLASRFSVLLRRALWFRLLLWGGVVLVLALIGARLGSGFGVDTPPVLIAQTVEPLTAAAPTAIAQPTSVSAAPVPRPTVVPAAPPAAPNAPAAAALPTPAALADGQNWPVLQQEPFEQVSASWPEVLGPSWWSRYRDGGYEVVLSGRPSISYSSPLPSHDFWFGADVQVAAGKAGLFFLLDRPNDFYRLLIDAEGRYRLEWQQVGYSRPLIDWTASAALHPGERAINQIAAQRQSDTLALYANGVLLNTYTLPSGNTLIGRVGLALDAPDGQRRAQAWFDNLVVRAPKQ